MRSLLAASGGAVVTTCLGCETYRVEYRHRPAYYQSASETELPDEVILEDGTKIVYIDGAKRKSALRRAAEQTDETGAAAFRTRDEADSGEVVLRAKLPEHVLSHLIGCLQAEEYELLWEQVVSERTKHAMRERGQDKAVFIDWATRNRRDLLASLNRMTLGLYGQDVQIESIGNNITRIYLHPRVASQTPFDRVDVVFEDYQFRLLVVK